MDILAKGLSNFVHFSLWQLSGSVFHVQSSSPGAGQPRYVSYDFFAPGDADRDRFLNNLVSLLEFVRVYTVASPAIDHIALPKDLQYRLQALSAQVMSFKSRLSLQMNISSPFPSRQDIQGLVTACHAITQILLDGSLRFVSESQQFSFTDLQALGNSAEIVEALQTTADDLLSFRATVEQFYLTKRRRNAFRGYSQKQQSLHAIATLHSLVETLNPQHPAFSAAVDFINTVIAPRCAFVDGLHHRRRHRHKAARHSAKAASGVPAPTSQSAPAESVAGANSAAEPSVPAVESQHAPEAAAEQAAAVPAVTVAVSAVEPAGPDNTEAGAASNDDQASGAADAAAVDDDQADHDAFDERSSLALSREPSVTVDVLMDPPYDPQTGVSDDESVGTPDLDQGVLEEIRILDRADSLRANRAPRLPRTTPDARAEKERLQDQVLDKRRDAKSQAQANQTE